MSRPRLPRSGECAMCHPYLETMPFEERQKIAAHRMEHQRMDRLRERYIRHNRKRPRATFTTSAATAPAPASAASSTRSEGRAA